MGKVLAHRSHQPRMRRHPSPQSAPEPSPDHQGQGSPFALWVWPPSAVCGWPLYAPPPLLPSLSLIASCGNFHFGVLAPGHETNAGEQELCPSYYIFLLPAVPSHESPGWDGRGALYQRFIDASVHSAVHSHFRRGSAPSSCSPKRMSWPFQLHLDTARCKPGHQSLSRALLFSFMLAFSIFPLFASLCPSPAQCVSFCPSLPFPFSLYCL